MLCYRGRGWRRIDQAVACSDLKSTSGYVSLGREVMNKDMGSENAFEGLQGSGASSGTKLHAKRITFSQALNALREEFHSTGRFDDGNAKLDEMSKILFVKFHEEKRRLEGKVYRFSIEQLHQLADRQFADKNGVAKALAWLFQEVAKDQLYKNPDGTSIFGTYPRLNIQPTDNKFAAKVVQLLNSAGALHFSPDKKIPLRDAQFDLLNEAFGHFVRDLFRNTKEDAQYMTPPEAVNAMVDIAFLDIERQHDALNRLLGKDTAKPYIILDPTCGVGSFLIAALRKANDLINTHIADPKVRADLKRRLGEASVWGQDKVDRMIRLAKLNLLFFGGNPTSIVQGNSILGESILDELHGRVDLILTNPPFGAKFELSDILSSGDREKYPMLRDIFASKDSSKSAGKATGRTIPSEIALLDRCLQLLRPGGRLLIVLPDNIVSAKGIHKKIRQWIDTHALVKGVIQLPSEAFAQAGTRTKTSIIYVQKQKPPHQDDTNYLFMAVCEDMGYKVVERIGTPTKVPRGRNQLTDIVDAYARGLTIAWRSEAPYMVSTEEPAAVWIRRDKLLNGRWTPSFYSPKRLHAIEALHNLPSDSYQILPLKDLASFITRERRSKPVSKEVKCISVLHVGQDGTINLREVEKYEPQHPARVCKDGDILFAKINPRIQRVTVVPKLPYETTCSSEFEILRAREGYSPHVIAALLRLPWVYDQIISLTGGTSSSHNRIKDTELRQVLLPVPRSPEVLTALDTSLKRALTQRYKADQLLRKAETLLDRMLENDLNSLNDPTL